MHRLRRFVFVLVLVCLSFCLSLSAAPPPQAGRIKVLVRWSDGRSAPVPVKAADLGGELVADYAGYRLITLPASALRGVEEKLRAHGLHAERRDDFDVLALPGGTIDTREPSGRARSEAYPAGAVGLHVVQLVGPPIPAWIAALRDAGAEVVSYVPHNGYLVSARVDVAAALRRMDFVQWAAPYHPVYKSRPAKSLRAMPVEIEIVHGADTVATIERVRTIVPGALEAMRQAEFVVLRAVAHGDAVDALLADPQVIAVSEHSGHRLSDERQVMATTTNVDVTGYLPTNPGTYRAWLTAQCSYCDNLNAEGFVVGVADSGIDTGTSTSGRHPDLASPATRVRFGTIFNGTDHADASSHGTMVAGIIAGDASTGQTDSGGFLQGMGMAPSAGLLSTKIHGVHNTSGTIFDWAYDATSGAGTAANKAFIQNHSNNRYATGVDGKYTAASRDYDIAVRDSNGAATGGDPITLTVASGNREPGFFMMTLPPGTGKNVISAGGAENKRPASEATGTCKATGADGFKYLSSYTKRDTIVSKLGPDGLEHIWSTYIKPDLTAPATFIVSAQSLASDYCRKDLSGRYMMESGTSFAAPVAAGAAILASRVYSEFYRKLMALPNPSAQHASPALLKAMLIANARSMMGGVDHGLDDDGTTTNVTIGPRPNARQGFGLIDTTGLFDSAAKSYVNQSHRFVASGEASWNGIFYRRDMTREVRAALTWTDDESVVGATLPLDNNLDLIVNIPSANFTDYHPAPPCSHIYWGNNPRTDSDTTVRIDCGTAPAGAGNDIRNNAELVLTDAAASRPVVNVTVTPTTVAEAADPAVAGANQDFALYLHNASQRGDVNHDGRVDLVWQDAISSSLVAWTDARNATTAAYFDPVAQPWNVAGMGDFDGNGSDDLVLQNSSTNEVQIRLLNKTATIGTVSAGTLAADWSVAGVGDFNGDGHVDIVTRSYATTGSSYGLVRFWWMYGTTVTTSWTVFDTAYQPALAAPAWRLEGVADFNGDGKNDFVWHNSTTGTIAFWFMNGMQYVSSTTRGPMDYATWRIGAVGDYNGDARNDVVWRNQTNGSNLIWFGAPGTQFPTTATIATVAPANWKIAGPR